MILDTMTLKDFRSHEHTQVTFKPGLNIVVGPNGSGKTSLAEAIWWTLIGPRNKLLGITEKDLRPLGGKRSPCVTLGLCDPVQPPLVVERSSRGCKVTLGDDVVCNSKTDADVWLAEFFKGSLHNVSRLFYVRQAEVDSIVRGNMGDVIYSVMGLDYLAPLIKSKEAEIRTLKASINQRTLAELDLLKQDGKDKVQALKKVVAELEGREDVKPALAEAAAMKSAYESGCLAEKERLERALGPPLALPSTPPCDLQEAVYRSKQALLGVTQYLGEGYRERILHMGRDLEGHMDPTPAHSEDGLNELRIQKEHTLREIKGALSLGQACPTCLATLTEAHTLTLQSKLRGLEEDLRGIQEGLRVHSRMRGRAQLRGLQDAASQVGPLREALAAAEGAKAAADAFHAAWQNQQEGLRKLGMLEAPVALALAYLNNPQRYDSLLEYQGRTDQLSATRGVLTQQLKETLAHLDRVGTAAAHEKEEGERVAFLETAKESLVSFKASFEEALYPALSLITGEIASILYGPVQVEVTNATVFITEKGLRKDFNKHANKGLQEDVALSLRLALLKIRQANHNEGCKFDFVILDEVTAFLDENRKRRLAEFLNEVLPTVSQVVMITHDPTIIEAADSIIHLGGDYALPA